MVAGESAAGRAVTYILAATYDDLIGDLGRVSRWTGKAAARGGGLIFNFSLRAARDQAWRAAVRLSAEDAATRRVDIAQLDAWVAVLAYLVTRPSPPVRWLVPLLRRFRLGPG